jgi:plasmid stabilization system protein ParE
MSLPYLVTPKARQDIVNIVDYLREHSIAAAKRFHERATASFERLSQMPELGTLCQSQYPHTVGTRVWPVTGFRNYLIFLIVSYFEG